MNSDHWKILTALVVLVALTLVYGHWRYSVADRHWQQRWSERDAADARAAAQRNAAERAEEQRRQQAVNEVNRRAQQQINLSQSDADSARAAADRLQHTVAGLQQRLHESKTRCNTGTTTTGQTTARQCDVLADLLSESVERNRQLAAAADRSRIAGLACERAWDLLTVNN